MSTTEFATHQTPTQPPRKRRHVFRWVFLGFQAVFLIWLIAGIASTSGSGADAHAQALSYCANGGWQGLFQSYSDCVAHYGNAMNTASDVGKSIGAAAIIGVWVAFDVIVGGSYAVYRLATRGRG